MRKRAILAQLAHLENLRTEEGKESDNLCNPKTDPQETIYTTSEDVILVFTSF